MFYRKALRLIRKNKRTKNPVLDLSNCGLKEIPKELEELVHLEQLYLDRNNIQNIQPIEKLHKLQVLYLNSNNIQNIQPIQKLHNLQVLYLSHNNIQNIQPIENLHKLQQLYLGGNNIQNIQPIKNLHNLQVLYLSHNNIQNIQPIKNLHNLQKLYLGHNNIQNIQTIENLHNLQVLDLHNNNIQNIQPIENLHKLQVLDLSYSNIQNIQPIKNLHNLQELYLAYNNIQNIQSIENLHKLQKLGLSHNNIQNIQSIKNLHNLQKLDLRSTKITSLQPLLPHIRRGLQVRLNTFFQKGINVFNTPLQYPPIEVVKEGNQAILNYFEELENQEEKHIYEAKLLLVGQGGAGKTSLAVKLQDENAPLPQEEDTTKGIKIHQLQFSCQEDKTFTLNVWDFGGQEIYHATHQFFLTKKSLYILLDDTRVDDKTLNDGTFRYWLETVGLFGGGSPLLIVQNEKGDRSKDIDFGGMQAQFPFLKEKFTANLATNRGLEAIHQAIQYYSQQLPHIGDALPQNWSTIRTELLELQANKAHITLQEYYAICAKHGMTDKKRALHLSEYLHNLGNFLHFQHDKILKNLVILQNKWATDAVYKVLDYEPIKTQQGYFEEKDLAAIWSEAIYEDHVHELLQLMLKFELCYELSQQGKYLIPQLLPASRPNDFDWDNTDNLQVHYAYKFMPRGLLSRLIVRMHHYVKDLPKWKNGVVLTKDKTRAFVQEIYGSSQLEVRVQGAEPRDFMVIIAEFIETLSNEFEGIEYDKKIPCICSECSATTKPHFYKFKDVKKALAKRKDLRCLNSFEDVSARKLIDNIGEITSSAMYEESNYLDRNPDKTAIEINNYITTPPAPAPEPSQAIAQPSEATPQATPKKFYEHWVFKVLVTGVAVGIFAGICAWWFEWSLFGSAFLIGFGATVFGLFLRGNPERRFFKWGVFCLWAAVGIMAFPFEFASNTNLVTSYGSVKLVFNCLSEWDWLFAILLVGMASLLFFWDYQRDKS